MVWYKKKNTDDEEIDIKKNNSEILNYMIEAKDMDIEVAEKKISSINLFANL